MGCGSSKAAAIKEMDITVKPNPDRNLEPTKDGDVEQVKTESGGAHEQTSDHQTTEKILPNPDPLLSSFTSSPPPSTDPHQHGGGYLLPNELTVNYQKPIAYKIPLNEDGKPIPRKPFVRRLEVK